MPAGDGIRAEEEEQAEDEEGEDEEGAVIISGSAGLGPSSDAIMPSRFTPVRV